MANINKAYEQQLRGIKNTPGTVHAANVTRWMNQGSNQVQLIYAKTEKVNTQDDAI